MYSVKIVFLCELCQLKLSGTCAVFGINTHFKVCFGGIGHDLTEQLGELRRMLSLFIDCLFPSKDLFPDSLPCGRPSPWRDTYQPRYIRRWNWHGDLQAVQPGCHSLQRRQHAMLPTRYLLQQPLQTSHPARRRQDICPDGHRFQLFRRKRYISTFSFFNAPFIILCLCTTKFYHLSFINLTEER